MCYLKALYDEKILIINREEQDFELQQEIPGRLLPVIYSMCFK
jgi:hypothetical protein